jgi:hypothetical protein
MTLRRLWLAAALLVLPGAVLPAQEVSGELKQVYSLTMNVGGDGQEIYPWTSYEERAGYDVSKLAQWEIVLSHMDRLGLQLMVITQEEENEQLLGKLTTLRKLYYRELIARFAHHHALIWDLSEEMDRWRSGPQALPLGQSHGGRLGDAVLLRDGSPDSDLDMEDWRSRDHF